MEVWQAVHQFISIGDHAMISGGSLAGADTTIIFVPPAFAADAIMEAADAGIKVIITITEGIPVADMVKAYA
ncbi:hypothetical protein FQR65_LT19643 [Abscondita terminalis]|nr:hypothetical protein FQR65_LT19643 [Abscondita terminalis]